MSDFVRKFITVILGIGTGQLGDGRATMYTLENHRVSANIQAYGGETQGMATVKIFGMTESLMNSLTTIGPNLRQVRAKNSIQLLAGEDPNSLSTVYSGTIQTAYADYNAAPEVPFEITATSASVPALKTAQPTAFSGTVTVDRVMRTIANGMGWAYENANVDSSFVLDSPTFNGSYLDQIKSCAFAVGIDYSTDNFTLSIKKQQTSFGGIIPVVSPSDPTAYRLIGYPTFSSSGIIINSLFIPSIRQGGSIQLKDSFITAANGQFIVNSVQHDIDSLVPGGNWKTTCMVYPHGLSS